MRRVLVLLVFLAACHGEWAWAQDETAVSKTCTWQTAHAASVAEVVANVRQWQGKCVRVKALHAGGPYATDNRLLSDRMAVLEGDEPRKRSLVINGRLGTVHERHRPRWEEVLGTVGSCEIAYEHVAAMQAADPDSIIMLTGLCHYTLDHFLVPLAHRAVEGPPVTRLHRSELGPDRLELLVVAPTQPGYQQRRETGERMFAALEEGDFKSFLALDEPEVARDLAAGGETSLGEADRERLAESWMTFEASAAALRAAGIDSRAKRRMLAERSFDRSAGFEVLNGADTADGAFWCRLREGAEENDLPVRAEDIDNDPSRPFFCIWSGDYVVFREGRVPSASVPLFEYGFLERFEQEPR